MTKSLICSPKRTAIGSFQGALQSFTSPQLGAKIISAVMDDSKIDSTAIDEVFMGCVLTAGVGQAPARQAAIFAGLAKSTPCTTIGKVCGSGLKSVMLADSAIRCGDIEAAIAGGMESMSQAPYLLPKMRQGLRLGNGELVDSMIRDGLWDVYNDFHMGTSAEMCVQKFKLSREAQDEYAKMSYQRALAATENNLFKNEIVPLSMKVKKQEVVFDKDEEPYKSNLDKIPKLRPVFDKEGTITAANASTLNDGAAAMVVCSETFAREQNLQPMARIVAQAHNAQEPEWFTTAPAKSMERAIEKAGLSTDQIDLWEINEAFAAVALANLELLGIDPEKVNVNGGSIALGHPIGASGARILVTLCHALKQQNKRYGVASLCIGGGEAVAVVIENLQL